MSILIIGQTSFIGQSLKNYSKTQDWTFCGFDSALDSAIWQKSYDCVINLALDPCVKEGVFSALDRQIGQKAQENGAHFIAFSSRAVYGVADNQITFREQSPFLENCSPYGQAKRQIEQDLCHHLDTAKLTILRPSNIFGFEYNADKPRHSFFGFMLHSLKTTGKINFDMAGQTLRDFLPVEGFVDRLVHIAENPQSGIYNIGSNQGTACGDIANWVIEGFGTGDLDINSQDIKDSFVLDCSLLHDVYSDIEPIKIDMKAQCLLMGQRLKESA